jgi:flavin-dependent dehydrogenase
MLYDAVVIGAGPAGCAAARLLAQAGWRIALVEKVEFPRRKVCGEFISATSEPLLRDLGIGDAFAAQAGPPVRRVGLFARDTVLSASMPRPLGETSGEPVESWGRALDRQHLDLLLIEAAQRAGATVWQPWSAIALTRGAVGHVCTIANKSGEQELFGRVVIAAQGSWDNGSGDNGLRDGGLPTAAAERRHRASDLLAFKAHLTDCDLPDHLMPLLVFPGGYGGMVRSDGGRVTLSCCIRRDALADCRRRHRGALAGEAVLAHIRAACRGVREATAHASLDGAWLSAGPIRPGIRTRYRDGMFFVGNIAGEAHPVIAEGISMAMQSALLLARRLLADPRGPGSDRTIARDGAAYAADWTAAFATRVHAAAAFAHLAMRPGATSLLLPVLRRFPELLTMGARLAGKAQEMSVAS